MIDSVDEVAWFLYYLKDSNDSGGCMDSSGLDRSAPCAISYPLMLQTWEDLAFIHWSYEPDAVQKLLPRGFTVDTFGDRAWVGIVPFRIRNLRFPFLNLPKSVSTFPETNLRTYVRGPDGKTGVWFFSLDAQGWFPVVGARISFHLPYMYSKLQISHKMRRVEYIGRRVLPGNARYFLVINTGPRLAEPEITPLDNFLTARYSLYTRLYGRWGQGLIEHDPWPLYRARFVAADFFQTLTNAAGLPDPEGQPIAHFVLSINVSIGYPHWL